MEIDEETDVSMLQFQLLNLVLDREIPTQEIKHEQLPGHEVSNDFETVDPIDNNCNNKSKYYRDLEDQFTSMWNQFVPSHVENMQYLVSEITNSDENASTEEIDEAYDPKLNNEISESLEISDIDSSFSISSMSFGDNAENIVAKSEDDFQIEDIQLVYDWQDDIKDFELQWDIADIAVDFNFEI